MSYPNCYLAQFNPSTLKAITVLDDSIRKVACYNMCEISFSSVLDCDDDQALEGLNGSFCLKQIADNEWEGNVTINGDPAIIYYDLTGVISGEYCTVYSKNNVYFHTGAGAYIPYSELTQSDCNTSFRVDRDLVFRTVKGYGGSYLTGAGCS